MDKGNCRGLLIGHHSALSSPSITQRALPSPTPCPSITSHVWAYRGVLSSCRRPIPLGLQGFPVAYALGTREVGSAPLSLTVHHRVTGEGERSSAWRWARKPGAQRCDLTASVTDARFICKGGREGEAPLGSQRSAGRRPRASKGPCGVGSCVNHKRSGRRAAADPGLHLRPGPEQRRVTEPERLYHIWAFLLLHTWGDRDPLGDMLQVTRPLVSGL